MGELLRAGQGQASSHPSGRVVKKGEVCSFIIPTSQGGGVEIGMRLRFVFRYANKMVSFGSIQAMYSDY